MKYTDSEKSADMFTMKILRLDSLQIQSNKLFLHYVESQARMENHNSSYLFHRVMHFSCQGKDCGAFLHWEFLTDFLFFHLTVKKQRLYVRNCQYDTQILL